MRKSVKILAVASAITIMSSFTSLAGWENSEQGWKYKDDNSQQYITSTWIESTTEKGLWYYLNADSIMATNTLIDNQYYVNEAGEWRESNQSSQSNLGQDELVESHDRKSGSYESNYSDMWIEGQTGSESSPTETTTNNIDWISPDSKGSSDGDSGVPNTKVCG